MRTYRRKPLLVRAEQFWEEKTPWPESVEKLVESGDPYEDADMFVLHVGGGKSHYIRSGNWVVYYENGSRVVVSDRVFAEIYESAEEE